LAPGSRNPGQGPKRRFLVRRRPLSPNSTSRVQTDGLTGPFPAVYNGAIERLAKRSVQLAGRTMINPSLSFVKWATGPSSAALQTIREAQDEPHERQRGRRYLPADGRRIVRRLLEEGQEEQQQQQQEEESHVTSRLITPARELEEEIRQHVIEVREYLAQCGYRE